MSANVAESHVEEAALVCLQELAALAKRSFSAADVSKVLGGNMLWVMRKAEAAAAAPLRIQR